MQVKLLQKSAIVGRTAFSAQDKASPAGSTASAKQFDCISPLVDNVSHTNRKTVCRLYLEDFDTNKAESL